ncbi:MAG: S-layer homology domain-containing protein [Deltaproteobacteria bacterium]
MKKFGLSTIMLLITLLSTYGFTYANFEIIQPRQGEYYLNNSQMLLNIDSVSESVYSDIKWYYNNKKVDAQEGNFIITLDSVDSGKNETAVIKAVYEGETKSVQINIYNQSVLQKTVNYLRGIQSADGSFGGYTGHYYIASALGDAGVDINIPKAGESTYIEYLHSLNITDKSTAGELSKLIYALSSLKKNPKDFYGKNVVQLLLDKQKNDGTFGEGVYTDVLAIIALDKSGVGIPKKNELIAYFEGLSYNNGIFEDWGFTDVDTTARIVRSLKILGCDNQHAIIKKAIESINKLQTASGAIEAWGAPNCDTTAEAVMMLIDLNINPTEGIWNKNGKNLITAMLDNQNEDGSFKSGFDIKYSTYEEISAITRYYLKYLIPFSGGNNSPGGSSGSEPQEDKTGSITISVSVIGKGEKEVCSLKKITVDENTKYGKTVLQALYQTGLNFKTKNDDAYISEIDGIKEDLTSTAGWKYKVNGKVPGVSAKNCTVKDKDIVIWFWSESAESDLPEQAEQQEQVKEPAMLESKEQGINADIHKFSDITENFIWAKKEIEYMVLKGVVEGTGEGKFEPERKVTREEVVRMIVAAIGEKPESASGKIFRDQDKIGSWAVPYISTAKRIGIIKGLGDDTFKPKEKITRQEIAAMISRALKYKNINLKENAKEQITDWNNVPQWARESLLQAANAGIIKGKKGGMLAGSDVSTRAEAVVMIYRMLEL